MPKTWVVICHRWRLHSGRPCRFLPHGKLSFYIKRCNLVFTLTSQPWQGISVVGCLKLRKGSCHFDQPSVTWEFPNVKKKAASSETSSGRHLAAMESNVLKDLLPLVEHMAVTRYDDGDAREPGWFQVKTVGSSWQVVLKDPDTTQQITCHGQTLDEAFALADLLLGTDSAPWEADKWARMRKKGNK